MDKATIRVTCLQPSLVFADGDYAARGDVFDLAYVDDPAGRRRLQRYVGLGYVSLASSPPAWWVDAPATIRMQATAHLSGGINRGDIFDHPASDAQHQNSGMSERQHAKFLASQGLAMLVDETPPWWNGVTRGSNLGRPLPPVPALV